jgi:lysozyme
MLRFKPSARLIALVGATSAAILTTTVPEHEGVKLQGYRDPVGIATSCVGHTGPDAVVGKRYTEDQCQTTLNADLEKHAQGVLACVHKPMTDGEKAAFTSFAFNVGVAKFCSSSMARKANAGDMKGACAELSKWVYAGGKPLPGLVKRRADERAICEGKSQ